jgi:tRNA pseudouridine55 synthase
LFGFLNIYKPEGMTSFDVVAVLRRITKIKQIGHTGTLDPMATGVLPICIGKATKLIEYLPDDKEYTATIQFGSDTDTYDKEGQITKIYNNKISKEQLIEVLKNFEGEIEQFPPIYSAIKVNGKKLYDYARKGETVEITPRKVFISKIQLDNFDEQNQQAQIKVACSKGTYIRSIAYDIGQKLNCGGHLIALERTKAGMFEVDTSINLENIKAIEDIELVNPLDVLPQPKYTLNEQEKEHIIHGMPIKNRFKNCEKVVFLVYGGKMYGIGYCEKDIIKVKKVFETE